MSRHILSCPAQLADGTGQCNDDIEVEAHYHEGEPQTRDYPGSPDELELVSVLGPCLSGHTIDRYMGEYEHLREQLDIERPEAE